MQKSQGRNKANIVGDFLSVMIDANVLVRESIFHFYPR